MMNKKHFLALVAAALMMLPLTVKAQPKQWLMNPATPQWGQSQTHRLPAGRKGISENPLFAGRIRQNTPASMTAGSTRKATNAYGAPAITRLSDGTELWGNITYSEAWTDEAQCGFYSFSTASTDVQPMFIDNILQMTAGGAYYDDTFHGIAYFYLDYFYYLYYIECDTRNWEITKVDDVWDHTDAMALAATYDPTTGVVYGIFSSQDGMSMEFGVIDYSTLVRTTIATCDIYVLAMACDSQGQLYLISDQGDLYRINKHTGELTQVGATGVTPDGYLQSACHDWQTDKLYWAAVVEGQTMLLEVNTATGKATKLNDFQNNEQLLCLYAPVNYADGAPAAADNLAANFPQGSLTGSISFTLPTTTAAGNNLTGTVGYTLYIDGEVAETGNGTPGQTITVNKELTNGLHYFLVKTANDEGEGKDVHISQWIGNDTPMAVGDLKLSYDKATQTATLTWSAPTMGVNGGYAGGDALRYVITRLPDNVVVADGHEGTTFTEQLSSVELKKYQYEVQAVFDDAMSEAATSNEIMIGEALELPYYEYFDDEDALSRFTIIDGNGNGFGWNSYLDAGRAFYYDQLSDLAGDDWLITPPVKMKNDRQYIISFKVLNGNAFYTEQVATALGQGDDPTQYEEVFAPTAFTLFDMETGNLLDERYYEFTKTVTVSESGDYRYGIHAVSAPGGFGFYVDSLSIVEGAKFTAPDSVRQLTVVPAEQGLMEADLQFTTPTLTADQQPLTEISRVDVILDDDDVVETLENPACGQPYTIHISGIEGSGFHRFTLIAYNNGDDRGVSNSAEAWIGQDIPLQPTDARMSDNLDGTCTLTWTAPQATGVHGGYVDVNNLTYNVYKNVDIFTLEPIETGISGTTARLSLPQAEEQELVEWVVKAQSLGGEGEYEPFNTLFVGTPYTLPFHESFSTADGRTFVWASTESDAYGRFFPTAGQSSDGDNYCLQFYSWDIGSTATFYMGNISLIGAQRPKLLFYYYATPGFDEVLQIWARTPDGSRQKLDEIDYAQLSGDEEWRMYSVDLTPLVGNAYFNIDFQTTSCDMQHYINIDDVNVREAQDREVRVTLSAPETSIAGKSLTATALVENIGDEATGRFSIDLIVDGTVVDTQIADGLDLLATQTFAFSYPLAINTAETVEVQAQVRLDDGGDFLSAEAVVNVQQPGFTAISDLSAEDTPQGAILSWTLPQYLGERTLEGFESYEPFTLTEQLGEWRNIDGDEQPTAYFRHLTYPNNDVPKGFMVFWPFYTNVATLMYPMLKPIEGQQYMAAFGTEMVNADDWLISPRLSGAEQTVTMYVQSQTDAFGLEDFEIRYSTTGNDVADFQTVAYEGQAPTEWTQIEALLPEGATYFAIHYTAIHKIMFMVDAVEFEQQAPEVTAFRIYRNGEFIDEVQADAREYIDREAATSENRVYNVTIVYASGESPLSNDAAIATVISTATTAQATVRTMPGRIIVGQASGQRVRIFTPAGALLWQGNGSTDALSIPVEPGLYLVNVGQRTCNLLVK